ncbi:unnamed protein product [Sympodiomycopsis kandeliae]
MSDHDHTSQKRGTADNSSDSIKNSIPHADDRKATVATLDGGVQDVHPPAYTGKRSWFRSTFTQATILGLCSFGAPGIWGALSSLGAGGQSSPATVNAANSITFVLMIFTSYLTSSLINIVGVPIALSIGAAGYAPYAAGLYLSSKTNGDVTWLVLVGATLCGLSAGVFWSTEGAVILSYPERHNVGKYVSYWLMFRVLGQLIGGAINLGLNADNNAKGSIATNTYIVFIVIQCLGPAVALLLSSPHKVQRKDRTPVKLNLEGSVKSECLAVARLLCRKEVYLILPLIWTATFSESLTSTYNVTYFTVRSRALGGFLSAILAMIANYILGFYLDWQKFSINTRGKSAFITVYTLVGATWIAAIVAMNWLHRHPPAEPLDWSVQWSFAGRFALYLFLQISFNVQYQICYWIAQGINNDAGQITRLASIVRGVESAGQALSYGLNATTWRLDAVASLNFGFWCLAVVPAWNTHTAPYSIIHLDLDAIPDFVKVTQLHSSSQGASPSSSRRGSSSSLSSSSFPRSSLSYSPLSESSSRSPSQTQNPDLSPSFQSSADSLSTHRRGSQDRLQSLRSALVTSLGSLNATRSRVTSFPPYSSIATRLEIIETPIPPNPAHIVPETPPTWPSSPVEGTFPNTSSASTSQSERRPSRTSASTHTPLGVPSLWSDPAQRRPSIPLSLTANSNLRQRVSFRNPRDSNRSTSDSESSSEDDLTATATATATATSSVESQAGSRQSHLARGSRHSSNASGSDSPKSNSFKARKMNRHAGYLPVHGAGRPSRNSLTNLLSWFGKNVKMIVGFSLLTVLLLQGIVYIPYMVGEERMRHWGLEAVPAQSPPEWMKPPWERPPPPPLPEGFHPTPPRPGVPAIPPHGAPGPAGNHFPPFAHPAETAFPPGEFPYSSVSDKLRIGPEAFPVTYSKHYQYDPAIAYPDGDPHAGVIPSLQLDVLTAPKTWARPPHPPTAPVINSTLWPSVPWSAAVNGSKTSFADSYKADAQPLSPDYRSPPFDGWRPPLEQLNVDTPPSEPLGRVQFPFEDPSRHSGKTGDQAREDLIKERQHLVKAAFQHAWEGYKKIAWGHDELKPVSEKPQDNFNGWGATIVDALDTLLIMGLSEDYDLARQHVRDIDFRKIGGERSAYAGQDGRIPVFETSIRYLGGFLAAYDLSGDELMRDRAEELAQLLEPAFGTNTGVPVGRIRFGSGLASGFSSSSILSEAGSMLLEYTRLWQVTGNRGYFDRVQRTTDWLERNMTQHARLGSLLPATIFPETGGGAGWYSFGGMCDSYYEYLVKQHQLMGGRLPQYSRMYGEAIDSARKWLIRDVATVPNSNLAAFGLSNRNNWEAKLEHLACFTGGMMGLGAKLIPARGQDYDLAQRVTETCWWTYNSSATGVGPEDTVFYRVSDTDRWNIVTTADGTKRRDGPNGYPLIGVRRQAKDYRGRPETIESVLYMWRITGDPIWQERGWQMFASWVTHSMTRVGFANIHDVTQVPAMLSDSMESFVFAETFKYYYLLFSPPDLISLDEYIFTTEAHPLLAPRNGRWTQPATGSKKFWSKPSEDVPHYNAESELYSGGENGPYGGLTNAQKHDIYNAHVRKMERQRKQAEMAQAKAKLNSIVERAMNASGESVSALMSRMKYLIGVSEQQEKEQRQPMDHELRASESNTFDLTPEQIQEAVRLAVGKIRAQQEEPERAVVEETSSVGKRDSSACEDLADGLSSVIIETASGPMEIRFADAAPASADGEASSADRSSQSTCDSTAMQDSDESPTPASGVMSQGLVDKLEALLSQFGHDDDEADEPLFSDVDDMHDDSSEDQRPMTIAAKHVERDTEESIEDDQCAAQGLPYDSGIDITFEEVARPSALPISIDMEDIQAAGINAFKVALNRLNSVMSSSSSPTDSSADPDETAGVKEISPEVKAKLLERQEELFVNGDQNQQRLGMGFGSRMYAANRG